MVRLTKLRSSGILHQLEGRGRKSLLLIVIVMISLVLYPLLTLYEDYAGLNNINNSRSAQSSFLLLHKQQLGSGSFNSNSAPDVTQQDQKLLFKTQKEHTSPDSNDPPIVVQDSQLSQPEQESSSAISTTHRVAGLSCEAHGGPSSRDAVEEMVYWRDIPADAEYVSPFQAPLNSRKKEELYLTFEPDEGGWNNLRMSMETAVALAVSMGRTLVLPPKMHFYRLWDGGGPDRNVIGFSDFFHFDSVVAEHAAGLKVISFEEFLQKEAMTGQLIDPATSMPSFPPDNRTDWTGVVVNYESTKRGQGKLLWEWMRNVTQPLQWAYDNCVVGFPSEPGKEAADRMQTYLQTVLEQDKVKYAEIATSKRTKIWKQRRESYTGNPTPVNASAVDRLAELLANREQICVYDETAQNTKVLHAIGETSTGFRLLIHFYAFLFFEDWKHDLWIKRMIRDHFRYIDEIQCGAARIIEQVRKRAREHGNEEGLYDAFHIRRGDFQYTQMHLSAKEIYESNTRLVVQDGRTVYVATDERNNTFFDPLREHYNLLFLDDFKDQIQGINPNYYGMLDQLVAYKADVFVGAFFSTFTGYINRLRGHHAQKAKRSGYQDGLIQSYYYVPDAHADFRHVMRTYGSVQQAFWQQEFHVCWRDIDHGVEEVFRRR